MVYSTDLGLRTHDSGLFPWLIPLLPFRKLHDFFHKIHHRQKHQEAEGNDDKNPAVGAGITERDTAEQPGGSAVTQHEAQKTVHRRAPVFSGMGGAQTHEAVENGKQQGKRGGHRPGKQLVYRFHTAQCQQPADEHKQQPCNKNERRLKRRKKNVFVEQIADAHGGRNER